MLTPFGALVFNAMAMTGLLLPVALLIYGAISFWEYRTNKKSQAKSTSRVPV